jgi:hypothetical protein
MAVVVTATPSSGVAVKTAFRIDASGLADVDITTYSSGVQNSEDEITYYFEMSEGGTRKGRSHAFAPDSSTGKHSWQNIICPDAGTYVFSVKKTSNNQTMGSTSVTIS